MSTLVADNPREQEAFNSMAAALSKLPLESVKEPEGGETAKALVAETDPKVALPPEKPVVAGAKPPEENPLESTKGFGLKTAEKFEAIKKARDEFKTKAAQAELEKKLLESQREDLNKQIAELRKTPANVPELDALKKERDQLNEILNIIRVEEHPDFQRKWNSKVAEQLELAKSVVGAALAARAANILAMNDGADKNEKLEELKTELSEDQIDELKDVRKNLRLIGLQRDSEVKTSREKYQELKAQENAKAAEREQSMVKLFKDTGAKLSDAGEGWAVFQKTADPEWNRAVDARLADAEALFSGKLAPEKVAESAYRAAAFPAVLQFTSTLMKKNQELEAQIAGMSAANPKLGTGGKATIVDSKAEIRNSANPQAALAKWTGDFMKRMTEAVP